MSSLTNNISIHTIPYSQSRKELDVVFSFHGFVTHLTKVTVQDIPSLKKTLTEKIESLFHIFPEQSQFFLENLKSIKKFKGSHESSFKEELPKIILKACVAEATTKGLIALEITISREDCEAFDLKGANIEQFIGNFECTAFASYQLNDADLFDYLLNRPNKEIPFFQYVKILGYEPFASPMAGDLVLYLSDSKLVHVGVYLPNDQVVSKWGKCPVFTHPLHAIPSQYGNAVVFLRRCVKLKVALIFLRYLINTQVGGKSFQHSVCHPPLTSYGMHKRIVKKYKEMVPSHSLPAQSIFGQDSYHESEMENYKTTVIKTLKALQISDISLDELLSLHAKIIRGSDAKTSLNFSRFM